MTHQSDKIWGRVHSVETGGIVDGPGVRYVLFMQGCPLRCKFCHNPDTWDLAGGKRMEPKEVVSDLLRYKNFIKTGGITISGGEPLMQIPFVTEVLKECKKHGVHTAIDTSGVVAVSNLHELLKYTDLILLDIKAQDTKVCETLTGNGNANAFQMLAYAQEHQISVWIRHVIVPGYTDDPKDAKAMAQRLKPHTCIQKIQILPFHKMGEYKWETLNLKYDLKDTAKPDENLISTIRETFRKEGFLVE
jgi:pyruvate formate lyase activating enzyme